MKQKIKVLTRSELIDELLKIVPTFWWRPAEEFHSEEEKEDGGIWCSGEDGTTWPFSGSPMLDYWGYDEDYEEKYSIGGVEKNFYKWLAARGWYVEWNDPGTAMIFKA